jgi:hypothetical protein
MAIDPEIDEKIKEAARILREDGHAADLKHIRAKLDKAYPDEPEPPDPDAPPPPPVKPEPSDPEPKKKSGWWPEGSLDDS